MFESFSSVLTLTLIGLVSLTVLMNRETVDLAFFKPHYEQWFSQAFEGHSTEIEDYSARWIQGNREIELTAKNIQITGENNVAETIGVVKGVFSVGTDLTAMPSLKRLKIDGGALTIVRSDTGQVRLGLGTPSTFDKVAPIWSSDTQSSSGEDSAKLLQALEHVSVNQADVFVQDQVNGIKLTLKNVDGDFGYDGTHLDIISSGQLEAGEQFSPFDLHLKTTLDRTEFETQIRIEKLNPIDIAPEQGPLKIIGNLDAMISLEADLSVLPAHGFQDLNVSFTAEEGLLKTGKTFKPFEQANIVASYNAEAQNVQVTDLKIKSEALNVEATGQLENIGTPSEGFLKQAFSYAADIGNLRLNPGKKFDGPILIDSGKIAGTIDMQDRAYEFKQVDLDFGSFQTALSGELIEGDKTRFSNISVQGKILGIMSPEQLLQFWPNVFANGAREWIERAVTVAELQNLELDVNIDENDLLAKAVSNEHLSLAFEAKNADVKYMQNLPPLRGAAGHGVLRGNRLDFTLTQGAVDDLKILEGVIEIPRLSPKGGDFTIDLKGVGAASEMMRITNFPPFEFAKRFGMDPKDIGGGGNVSLSITRPLLQFFDQSRIRYDLDGDFSDISLPVGVGSSTLNSGRLNLSADSKQIRIAGPISLGTWESNLDWSKELGDETIPARYKISGDIDRDDLDDFGIGLRRHFGGKVHTVLSGAGDGLEVQRIKLDADFKDADINIGSLWQKPIGTQGTLSGYFLANADNGVELQDFVVQSEGLVLEGGASLAQNYKLRNLDIRQAKIDGFVNAAIQAKPTSDGVLSMFLTGDYLNVETWVQQAFQSQSSVVTAPIRLTASIKTLSLNEFYGLSDASALFSHDGVATQQARLKGQAEKGAFLAEVTSDLESGNRSILVELPDAGKAMSSLLGLDSIRDGDLRIVGTLPPAGQPGGVQGKIEATEFTLIRAPAFAQVLSLASLTGLADTLGGSGLRFTDLESQFALENGVFKIREGRASGPALGLTMEGDVGIASKAIDMNGVLVPSYSVNSVLGDIPLLGDIVVGKKGEGMFAINYSIKGPFSATQVAVNPLSALTPWILTPNIRRKKR